MQLADRATESGEVLVRAEGGVKEKAHTVGHLRCGIGATVLYPPSE